jgi:nitroimidazol reductase NimA-like FMN-containing flavoprotein (pyridoxamine 5'-phosphate oxidase superfamily)
MNKNTISEETRNALQNLLATQNLAVLATHGDGQPYTSLVAFASSDDLKELYFVTAASTRKFANLETHPRAAMMMDNRSNSPADIAHAMAVTATGEAAVAHGKERERLTEKYLAKHPHLSDFVKSPSTRLIKFNVACYYVVTRFQNVVELHMRK